MFSVVEISLAPFDDNNRDNDRQNHDWSQQERSGSHRHQNFGHFPPIEFEQTVSTARSEEA